MEQRGTNSVDRSQQLAEILGEMLGLPDVHERSIPPANDELVVSEEALDGPKQEWLSVKDACGYIHVSRSTLYRLVREGKLPSHHVRSRILLNKEMLDQCIKDGSLA